MAERVAVIAVHGIGHHEPRQAARACADMLALTGNYEPFVESPLRIPVQALRANAPLGGPHAAMRAARPAPERGFFARFDERPAFVREKRAASPSLRARPKPEEDPEILYMREQLSEYEPHDDECVYETVALHSKSSAAHGTPATEVHVYDMYWTDLSRVSTAGMRMIGELYQLLFYVSGLGRHTLDFATHKYPDDRAWSLFARFQRYAERLLVLWIPVLNLCAAGLVIELLPKVLVEKGVSPLVIVGFFLAAFAFAGWALARWRAPGAYWPYMFFLLIAGAALASLFGFLEPFVALALVSWLFSGATIVGLMYIYGKRRPGAWEVAAMCVGATTLILTVIAWRAASGSGIPAYTTVALDTAACIYWWGIHVAWSAFLLCTIAVSVLGWMLATRHRESADRRTIWTANVSLAIPGLMVLVLNLALWQAVRKLVAPYVDPESASRIAELVDVGTPWSLGVIMGVAIAAMLSTVWGMLPSVLADAFGRKAGGDRVAFGQALSQEFKLLRFWAELLRLAVILLPVLHLVHASWTDDWKRFSAAMTAYVGLALVAILFGPFAQVGSVLRAAIDMAIDVSNWLRLHPKAENPRAKICARFASLLRNVMDFRGDDGKAFDRVVVFCHSQGTAISAELLRYLAKTRDPLAERLARTSVVLFTMGCPLRQLYSQRFPIQYGWARDENAPASGHGVSDHPDPVELNVDTWINAYRSGDYVGRELWTDESYAADPVEFPPAAGGKGRRVDACIGAGGHTHYWDDSAMPVARFLDEAVRAR